ncbi:hypothetical protein VNI00_004228 [Paramarasmius palmivorus]|uniref:F-box domain-containing protein n=1 Tax=Paramarasmius palmivorus TaxID=297713 RepID=A0AAW0DNW5_9AGAR
MGSTTGDVGLDSPFENLLHTNYVPSPAERKHIKLLRNHARSNLSQLEQLLATLNRRRHELLEQLVHPQPILSPTRRIPCEVLSRIFLFCTPQEDIPCREFATPDSPQDAPQILAAVCRLWRQVASNNPLLWTCVYVSFPAFRGPTAWPCYRTTILHCQEKLRLWLARSRQVPVAIIVNVNPLPGHLLLERRLCHRVIEQLLPHSYRWRSLSLQAPIDVIERFAQVPVPVLESLLISPLFTEELPTANSSPLLDNLLGAHSLRVVLVHTPYVLSLPRWTNVTEIEVSGVAASLPDTTAAELLKATSTSIRIFRVAVTLTAIGDVTTACFLPELVTLHLLVNVRELREDLLLVRLAHLVNAMHAQKLCTLSIISAGYRRIRCSYWPFVRLLPPQTRLHSLELDFDFTPEALVLSVRQLSSLRILKIYHAGYQPLKDLITALTIIPGHAVCPDLNALHIAAESITNLETLLLDLVISRTGQSHCDKPPFRLDLFTVQPPSSTAVRERFRSLRSSHVSVQWKVSSPTTPLLFSYEYSHYHTTTLRAEPFTASLSL